jgi:ADP-L-glycero-D-manno-heptose 6-epimerase
MKILVTGHDGFIGRNMVGWLANEGWEVDGWEWDPENYPDVKQYDWVIHLGSISNPKEQDVDKILKMNLEFSQWLFKECQDNEVHLQYASSSAVYGAGPNFSEFGSCNPQTPYAWSKYLFDRWVFQQEHKSYVQGFRYFNVYGPRESHKGRMASVAFHQYHQYKANGHVKLFGEYGGYGPGEQSRDFVSVEDVVKVNLFFLDHPEISGIFNLGSGRAQPFNDVAHAVANAMRKLDKAAPASLQELVKEKAIEYIPFPDALKGKYQCFTQADLTKLRAAGYTESFLNVEQGVGRYIEWLEANSGFLANPL